MSKRRLRPPVVSGRLRSLRRPASGSGRRMHSWPALWSTTPADLPAFHAKQARRYIGVFALSATNALITNFVLGGTFNIAQWTTQNFAVIPMLTIALIAMIWRKHWIDIAAPILLSVIWIFYFVDLQGALK